MTLHKPKPATTLKEAKPLFNKQKLVVVKRPGDKHIKICDNYQEAIRFFARDTKPAKGNKDVQSKVN